MANLKDKTNTDLVKHIMEIGGTTGAMKQLVIMHIIRQGAQNIIDSADAIRESKEGAWSFIDRESWIKAAEEIIDLLDQSGR